MTNVISCTLVLAMASGFVPLAGISAATSETLPVYYVRGYIGLDGSTVMPAHSIYLPIVRRNHVPDA